MDFMNVESKRKRICLVRLWKRGGNHHSSYMYSIYHVTEIHHAHLFPFGVYYFPGCEMCMDLCSTACFKHKNRRRSEQISFVYNNFLSGRGVKKQIVLRIHYTKLHGRLIISNEQNKCNTSFNRRCNRSWRIVKLGLWNNLMQCSFLGEGPLMAYR